MKIRLVEAELFHSDGRTDGRTWRSWQSLFAFLRTRPKTKRDVSEAGSVRNVLLVTTGKFFVKAGDVTQEVCAVRTVPNMVLFAPSAVSPAVCSPCLY
jgi:hypothetical protein